MEQARSGKGGPALPGGPGMCDVGNVAPEPTVDGMFGRLLDPGERRLHDEGKKAGLSPPDTTPLAQL